jgi:hypothetical protein
MLNQVVQLYDMKIFTNKKKGSHGSGGETQKKSED